MMKKQKTKSNQPFKNKQSLISIISMTIVCAVFSFVVFSLTILTFTALQRLFIYIGWITEKTFASFAIIETVILFILLGCFISLLMVNYPIKLVNKVLHSFDMISKGDFSVRLSLGKTPILKRVSERFNNMTQQLESTEMLSNDFIGNFSHEFKTPINSINGFAKLILDDNLTDEQKDYLHIIIQESERLSKLSNSVLTLSKLEQQGILTNTAKVDISEQIRLVVGTLYHKWSDKSIEIIFDCDEFFTLGNKEMLSAVWMNLIENAIKFTPDGGRIEISIIPDGDMLKCSVSNQGAPIPPEKQPRLFDKFYQTDASHSTSGNGLGLATVKKIVELHNGKVYLKKSDEESTVFEVSLHQTK